MRKTWSNLFLRHFTWSPNKHMQPGHKAKQMATHFSHDSNLSFSRTAQVEMKKNKIVHSVLFFYLIKNV